MIRWADATGTVIPGVIWFGGQVLYVDSNKYLWTITNTNTTITFGAYEGSSLRRAFASTNCTGPAYYVSSPGSTSYLPAPRLTFQVPGKSEVRVRLDTATYTQVGVCSNDTGSTCGGNGPCPENLPGIAESDTIVVTPPSVSAVPPLHPILP
jgi:hypothetical protein